MPERRTAAKLIRFHAEELARITERAQECGRTPARFIRETALGSIPRPRRQAPTDALLRSLARIGRCLDELAHLAKASQHAALADQARAILDLHWALVREIVKDRRRSESGTDLPPRDSLTMYHEGARP
ncbi:MAG TPA: hypothetical protein VM716_04980 [Gemmatimonadales bacterium]|nr:hypothetical protein [Gemmatimonadales bacterium]